MCVGWVSALWNGAGAPRFQLFSLSCQRWKSSGDITALGAACMKVSSKTESSSFFSALCDSMAISLFLTDQHVTMCWVFQCSLTLPVGVRWWQHKLEIYSTRSILQLVMLDAIQLIGNVSSAYIHLGPQNESLVINKQTEIKTFVRIRHRTSKAAMQTTWLVW